MSPGRRRQLRDVVRIGQCWQLRTRKRAKPTPVVIYQVKRGPDQEVYAYREGDDPRRPGVLFRISFADLRRRYKLLDSSEEER
jgi:hypothetical protein